MDKAVDEAPEAEGLLTENDEYVDVTVGIAVWKTANDLFFMEEDFHVAGEV